MLIGPFYELIIFLIISSTRKNYFSIVAEIDRCLKKVAEGVEKFEETWKKVQTASNSNQKVKVVFVRESDGEILYVHVVFSGEIRGRPEEGDKKVTAIERPNQDMGRKRRSQGQVHTDGQQETHRDGETRMDVEIRDLGEYFLQQMERFKIVEREAKTKAYSKEGLVNSSRMDPAEKEKYNMQQWLNQCIDTLNIQVDQFEAEIETLSVGGKKGKKKNDDAERREECQVK